MNTGHGDDRPALTIEGGDRIQDCKPLNEPGCEDSPTPMAQRPLAQFLKYGLILFKMPFHKGLEVV